MATHAENFKIASKRLARRRSELTEFYTELRVKRAAEFTMLGGCPRCRGRGWVVIWDTMDSMSGCYAEYGGCPDAKDNPSAHGPDAPFDHSRNNKYDGLHHRGVKISLVQTKLEAQLEKNLKTARLEAEVLVEVAREAGVPTPGRIVEVFKGRKVAKGTKGRVFWYGPCRYGDGHRVGFKTAEGEKHFTAESNVEVL